MAGSANITLNATAILGNSQGVFNQQSAVTVAGTHKYDAIVDVDATGGALSTGPVATPVVFMAWVSTGTAAATVSFYQDVGLTKLHSGPVAQNSLGCYLVSPGTVYAKASAGTVQVRVFAFDP